MAKCATTRSVAHNLPWVTSHLHCPTSRLNMSLHILSRITMKRVCSIVAKHAFWVTRSEVGMSDVPQPRPPNGSTEKDRRERYIYKLFISDFVIFHVNSKKIPQNG